MGFVYVIEASGAFKVGIAEDVTDRLGALQVGSPDELSLRSYWEAENARAVEQALHRHLAQHRKRGEWFDVAGLPICEVEIQRLREEGVLFEPGEMLRFPRSERINRSATKTTFLGTAAEAVEFLWPTGHFPRWEQGVLDRPIEWVSGASPVMRSRGGTYHYPLLFSAIRCLQREAAADPEYVRDLIVSRGEPPFPTPDPLTAVARFVHSPAVCSNPRMCPGLYVSGGGVTQPQGRNERSVRERNSA